MSAAVVEWSKLGQVAWVSLLAGIGVTLVYSLVILGSARAGDARRAGNGGAAAAYGALAVVSLLLFAAGVVFGIQIILQK